MTTMRAGSPFARWFASIGLQDRPTVGGKGASLGELDRAGIRVPPGFVVTTAAFERMLAALDRDGAIRARIAALDANDLPGITNACKDIRARIELASLPTELRAAILDSYRELNGPEHDVPVAVRSSATSEDSAEASFAGLQDTYLWVRGAEGVAHAVRSCWASLYSVESVSYRLRLEIPENQVAMGVVVQRMVNSHCSGVMFTRSPTTGDQSVVAIEGSWGLGSSIVSGEVTPDKFVVSKVTGEIVHRTVSDKLTQHLPDAIAGGVRHEPVPENMRSVPCLSDDQLAELAQVAKRVERHYGAAQDIEWAIAHGERGVYLLQSRPETVWARKSVAPVAAPKAKPFDHVLSLLSGRQR
jgi:phosphoenolpyruvate synthase/pyruvate phosphate dikinase